MPPVTLGPDYAGRAAEILGDTATAVAAYEKLADAWGEAIREVPLVADTYDRLSALAAGGSSDTPR